MEVRGTEALTIQVDKRKPILLTFDLTLDPEKPDQQKERDGRRMNLLPRRNEVKQD